MRDKELKEILTVLLDSVATPFKNWSKWKRLYTFLKDDDEQFTTKQPPWSNGSN